MRPRLGEESTVPRKNCKSFPKGIANSKAQSVRFFLPGSPGGSNAGGDVLGGVKPLRAAKHAGRAERRVPEPTQRDPRIVNDVDRCDPETPGNRIDVTADA